MSAANGSGGGPVASPCTHACRLDDDGRVCLGCGRTMSEITAWRTLSDDERSAIVDRLATLGTDLGDASRA